MFPPFASSAGIPASGLRYESDDARVIHPLPHNIIITIGSVGRREGLYFEIIFRIKIPFQEYEETCLFIKHDYHHLPGGGDPC